MIETRLIERARHRPDDMLELVADVERYPEFINLLSAVRVNPVSGAAGGAEVFTADASVNYKMVSETFRSRVEVDREQKRVIVTNDDKKGPVRDLLNVWQFYPLRDGSTLIGFDIRVELKLFPLEMILRSKFESATLHMMKVFRQRADSKYPVVGDEDFDFAADYDAFETLLQSGEGVA